MKTGRLLRIVVLVLTMTFAVSMASAQLNSGAQTIALNANLTESLTLSLSAIFFVVALFFVYRSFYGMRIESGTKS